MTITVVRNVNQTSRKLKKEVVRFKIVLIGTIKNALFVMKGSVFQMEDAKNHLNYNANDNQIKLKFSI